MFTKCLLKHHVGSLSVIARVFDNICIFLGGWFALFWVTGQWSIPTTHQYALLNAILFSIIVFTSAGIYQSWRGISLTQQARAVSLAWFSVFALLAVIGFVTNSLPYFSQNWVITWMLFTWFLLLAFRFSLGYFLKFMRKNGWNHKGVIIVGAGDLGRRVVDNIQLSGWTGLDVLGFYDDNEKLHNTRVAGIKVRGGIDKITSRLAKSEKIDEIWLALPLSADQRLKDILYTLRHNTVTVRLVPDIFGMVLLNHSLSEVAGLPVLNLTETPMHGVNRFVKGIEDRIVALCILLLISPLMLAIAIGVKLSSPGPMIFRQKRHGWDGKVFDVYKFRTMKLHGDGSNIVQQACQHDERVTKYGAFLRRTSFDELPQFFNVIQGRMSIVGPRPHAVEHNEQYKEQVEAYMKRHIVKPGITGWAQVNGWRGETDTIDKMRNRVEHDLYYVDNWSLWFDLKIILLTLRYGFTHKNAY